MIVKSNFIDKHNDKERADMDDNHDGNTGNVFSKYWKRPEC